MAIKIKQAMYLSFNEAVEGKIKKFTLTIGDFDEYKVNFPTEIEGHLNFIAEKNVFGEGVLSANEAYIKSTKTESIELA